MFKRMSLTAKKVTDSAREAAAGEQEAGGEEEAAAKGEEVAKNLIGYNRAKRGMAKEMGIDPYSDNEVLQAELERLAKAAFAGGLAFDVLAPSVPLQGEIVMVSDMVWTRSPADLEVMNREKLVGLGISKETVDTFYRNEHFTPSTQTALVALVEKLEGVKNLGAIPRLASRLKSSDEVRFFIHTAAILTRYHEEDPLQRIAGRHVLPWGVRADGKTVLPAAIDHMVWTKRTSEAFAAAEKARAEEESLGAMELRVSGTLSPRTRREVESLGWRVEEKALRAN
jgi:hypothetical protein